MRSKLITILVLLMMVLPVSAHPGKTDANGGHRDSSTGEYHYHHGFPAHQHYDMNGDGIADCPYGFKDNTAYSSGIPLSAQSGGQEIQSAEEWLAENGGSKSYQISKYIYTGTPATSAEQTELQKDFARTEISEAQYIGYSVVVSLVAVALAFWDFSNRGKAADQEAESSRLRQRCQQLEDDAAEIDRLVTKNKELIDHLEDLHEKQLDELHRESEEILTENAQVLFYLDRALRRTYGQNYVMEISGAPKDAFIDAHGLPHRVIGGHDEYTFCVTENRVHRPSCHTLHGYSVVNAANIKNPIPCKICNPELPDLKWFDKYGAYQRLIHRYDYMVPEQNPDR